MSHSSRGWTAIIVATTIAAGLVTFSDMGDSPLRTLIVGWFLLVCPGMAFTRLMHLNEGFTGWTLAIALSLALDALVAGALLYTGRWSLQLGIIVLMWFSLLGLSMQIPKRGVDHAG